MSVVVILLYYSAILIKLSINKIKIVTKLKLSGNTKIFSLRENKITLPIFYFLLTSTSRKDEKSKKIPHTQTIASSLVTNRNLSKFQN